MEHYLKALAIPEERLLGAEHHTKQVQEKKEDLKSKVGIRNAGVV